MNKFNAVPIVPRTTWIIPSDKLNVALRLLSAWLNDVDMVLTVDLNETTRLVTNQ